MKRFGFVAMCALAAVACVATPDGETDGSEEVATTEQDVVIGDLGVSLKQEYTGGACPKLVATLDWGMKYAATYKFELLNNGNVVDTVSKKDDEGFSQEFWPWESGTYTVRVTHNQIGSTIQYRGTSTEVRISSIPRPSPDYPACGKVDYSSAHFEFDSHAPIAGRYCTQIIESADPYTWNDNFLCAKSNWGIRWSGHNPIPGMKCTQIIESADPHTWNDNYLCVPTNSPLNFSWSGAGPIAGKTCVQFDESADPHTWLDNYLCY